VFLSFFFRCIYLFFFDVSKTQKCLFKLLCSCTRCTRRPWTSLRICSCPATVESIFQKCNPSPARTASRGKIRSFPLLLLPFYDFCLRSVQTLRSGGGEADLFVYDGNTGANNIGNSDRVFYMKDLSSKPVVVLNVTRDGCLLNDLIVTSGGVYAVCGTGQGDVLVFRCMFAKKTIMMFDVVYSSLAGQSGQQFVLISNISQTTYDDAPRIFALQDSLLIVTDNGNFFTSHFTSGTKWLPSGPQFDSSLTYQMGATSCNQNTCLVASSACRFIKFCGFCFCVIVCLIVCFEKPPVQVCFNQFFRLFWRRVAAAQRKL
jgi:hypothetical protein